MDPERNTIGGWPDEDIPDNIDETADYASFVSLQWFTTADFPGDSWLDEGDTIMTEDSRLSEPPLHHESNISDSQTEMNEVPESLVIESGEEVLGWRSNSPFIVDVERVNNVRRALTPVPPALQREEASISSIERESKTGTIDVERETIDFETGEMMQQMSNDMKNYYTRREKDFGREYGYELYDRTPATNLLGISSVLGFSSEAGVSERTRSRAPRVTSAPWLYVPEIRGLPRSGRSSRIVTRTTARIPIPLTPESVNHMDDFFKYLFLETDSRIDAHSLANFFNSSSRFVLGHDLPAGGPTDEDEESFKNLTRSLGMAILSDIIEAARSDGMDVRDGVEFLRRWRTFTSTFTDPLPPVGGMLHIQVMQFWVALRRGLRNWIPSESFLTNIAQFVLSTGTRFNHSLTNFITRNSLRDVMFEIRMSRVDSVELVRFYNLAREGLHPARIDQLFNNWMCTGREGAIENSRHPSEGHFSDQELLLDRLERLIREEMLINGYEMGD